MCDCYFQKCCMCDNKIYLHLGDYRTQRDEIKIYCKKHIPKNNKNGIVWKYWETYKSIIYKGIYYIELLTENAKDNWKINCYNGKCIPVKVYGKKVKGEKY